MSHAGAEARSFAENSAKCVCTSVKKKKKKKKGCHILYAKSDLCNLVTGEQSNLFNLNIHDYVSLQELSLRRCKLVAARTVSQFESCHKIVYFAYLVTHRLRVTLTFKRSFIKISGWSAFQLRGLPSFANSNLGNSHKIPNCRMFEKLKNRTGLLYVCKLVLTVTKSDFNSEKAGIMC